MRPVVAWALVLLAHYKGGSRGVGQAVLCLELGAGKTGVQPERLARMKTELAAWQKSVLASLNGGDYPK